MEVNPHANPRIAYQGREGPQPDSETGREAEGWEDSQGKEQEDLRKTLHFEAEARAELDAKVSRTSAVGVDGALEFVLSELGKGEVPERRVLEQLKRQAAVEFLLDRYLSNQELLAAMSERERERFKDLLRVHPRRSASGIVVVTAFSKPFSCPHGTCTFCPGGPRFGTPQSYLPQSPGMKAALTADFDPVRQVRGSIDHYVANGHGSSKVETIIEGGTFIAVPESYQEEFVKGVFDGLNGSVSPTLAEAHRLNETAASRCVGLSLESKPDWCRPRDIDLMLHYGVTRLEIGVQSLHEESLLLSNRGHTVEDTAKAFRVARDAGLKITAHMMPGLPGAVPAEDLADFRRIFDDDSFRPDMTKIYPTLVIPGTALAMQERAGLFEAYDLETVVELISEMKRSVPKWHRIMRIQREIPAMEIASGVKQGNLRQLVLQRALEKGYRCQCIRCREVALEERSGVEESDELLFTRLDYDASGGKESFGSFEYRRSGFIAGFFRLRLPSALAHRAEVGGASIVRELRVYGKMVDIGDSAAEAWQHKGIGARLMAEAERIAREEHDSSKLLVTSAVGTREYYRRLGFERTGPYMGKAFR